MPAISCLKIICVERYRSSWTSCYIPLSLTSAENHALVVGMGLRVSRLDISDVCLTV